MKTDGTPRDKLDIVKEAGGIIVRFVDIRSDEVASVFSDNADILRRIKEIVLPAIDGRTAIRNSNPSVVVNADWVKTAEDNRKFVMRPSVKDDSLVEDIVPWTNPQENAQ